MIIGLPGFFDEQLPLLVLLVACLLPESFAGGGAFWLGKVVGDGMLGTAPVFLLFFCFATFSGQQETGSVFVDFPVDFLDAFAFA